MVRFGGLYPNESSAFVAGCRTNFQKRFAEAETHPKRHAAAHQSLDDPRTQFLQVFHEGHAEHAVLLRLHRRPRAAPAEVFCLRRSGAAFDSGRSISQGEAVDTLPTWGAPLPFGSSVDSFAIASLVGRSVFGLGEIQIMRRMPIRGWRQFQCGTARNCALGRALDR